MAEPTQQYFDIEDVQRKRDKSQFYTPPWLAERVWQWMRPRSSPAELRILEPSAGRGALIKPLLAQTIRVQHHVSYETDPKNVTALHELLSATELSYEVRALDFLLADLGDEHFDISVANTPYEDDQDIDFASRILGCCTYVAGIWPARMQHSAGRGEFWRWTDIHRKVNLLERPKFGNVQVEPGKKKKSDSGATDFVVLELRRRRTPRKQGEACTTNVEWW